jgi:hypothetical protein
MILNVIVFVLAIWLALWSYHKYVEKGVCGCTGA